MKSFLEFCQNEVRTKFVWRERDRGDNSNEITKMTHGLKENNVRGIQSVNDNWG